MHFVCGKCGAAPTSALLGGKSLEEGDKIDCSQERGELVRPCMRAFSLRLARTCYPRD